MISLKHINKRFDDDYVLKDINLTLPRTGIVTIYGPSGCGKTTLLNSLSSLFDFEGDVNFDGKNYSALKEEEKDILRNNKIGFVFQDYKLFEFESIENNLLIALDIKSIGNLKAKKKRINDLLKIVDLLGKSHEIAANLSGGEKQRLAIARAICNSPKVLLADEPTGNLDNKNSELVMSLLSKISSSSLVILVSHDENLTKKYADMICYMKDGSIYKQEYNFHNKQKEHLPLLKLNKNLEKPKLPIKFCLSHTINNLKRTKWRTSFSTLVTSLGLIGVGLGSMINSIISENVLKSYSSIISSNNVIITPKNATQNSQLLSSMPLEEVLSYKEEYNAERIGVYYFNNFENFFETCNFYLESNNEICVLPDFYLRSFNDYTFLNKQEVLPLFPGELKDEEVILCLNIGTINELCYQLKIPRTIDSLSTYFSNYEISISVDISNTIWDYKKQFSLKALGFIVSENNGFAHNYDYWNEYIYENCCGLTISNIINATSEHPWDLKKAYYLEFFSNRDKFLEDIRFKKENKYCVGEILTSSYYPLLYKNALPENCNRVVLLNIKKKDYIDAYYSPYFKNVSKNINKIIYGSYAGYAIFPDNLMMGFARQTFLSNDTNYLEDIIDLTSYVNSSEDGRIAVKYNVIRGFFAQNNESGFSFNPSYKLIKGKEANYYNEIVISNLLAKTFFNDSALGRKLYICYPVKEELLPNGYISRDYLTVSLKVVGVSNSIKNEIHHKEEWSIMFFQTKLGISSTLLSINSIAIDVKNGKENEVIRSFTRSFPDFEVSSPISSVKESVNKICGYIETILLILSISSVIISSLLLSICNYLHFLEIKKDIGLIRCLGIGRKESKKLVYIHSFLTAFVSFVISVFELIVISLVISKALANSLLINETFVFNPLSMIYMFILSFGIALVSSMFINKKINRLNAIECLY